MTAWRELRAKADQREASEAAAQNAQDTLAKLNLGEHVAREHAMADAGHARQAGADLKVFGVALGSPLGSPTELPVCEEVQTLIGANVSAHSTCLWVHSDGPAEVHWASDALPSWAQAVTTDVRGDVLTSVRITFEAIPRAPSELACATVVCMSMAEGLRRAHEDAIKRAPEDVTKAHKQLRAKYGKPTRSKVAIFKSDNGHIVREVEEMEWTYPGLHVAYQAGPTDDTVLIELESIRKDQARKAQQQLDAEPKL
ncbi:MAG: hypothetical protein WDO69_04375 [Pseudomonadota bacterium]